MSGLDMKEFDEFIREHQSGIRAFIRSLGIYPHAVDDVAQEVFFTVWKERDRFDQARDFGLWLRGIARNIVQNERRKGARRSRIMSSHLADILDMNYPEREILEEDARGLMDMIVACIGELPERSRFIIMERYGRESPIEGISRAMKSSEVAIRQTLSRIRQALRKCVDEKKQGVGV